MQRVQVESFLDSVVPELSRLHEQVERAYWALSTGGGEEARAAYVEARGRLDAFLSRPDLMEEVAGWMRDGGKERDPLLFRQLEVLWQTLLPAQGPPDLLAEIAALEAEVEEVFAGFRARVGGREVTDNDIEDILARSDRVDERREAWLASREVGAQVADRVRRLVRLRNRLAQQAGFPHYYALSLAAQDLTEGELWSLLDDLGARTEAPFRRGKAELDRSLAERLRVPVEELLPWHYGDRFFQEPPRQGPDLDPYLAGKDLTELARAFYEGLGLEVDGILGRSDLYERPGKNQHAFCAALNRSGDVRVLTNLRPTEKWLETLLHELGHAVYDVEVDPDLPWLLRTPPHIACTEAVAMLMGRQTWEEDFLHRILGLPLSEARDLARRAAPVRRFGTLVFLRWALVVTSFERSLYQDPEQDPDARWWELVERYQGLRRPPGLPPGNFAAKIHVATAPVYYQNYVLGELIAAQLRAHLLGRSLVCRREAGDLLREHVLRPGASLRWTELVRRATGRPLGASALLAECGA